MTALRAFQIADKLTLGTYKGSTVEVTFAPAPEFVTPALPEDETERLIAATRGD
jgi:hypothetical protein